MSEYENETVVVTGANAGLGFEAAAQFAERGYGTVVLACRTEEKAEAAAAALRSRTGKDVFATLAVDVADLASARAAADALAARASRVDVLVLNAGLAATERTIQVTIRAVTSQMARMAMLRVPSREERSSRISAGRRFRISATQSIPTASRAPWRTME